MEVTVKATPGGGLSVSLELTKEEVSALLRPKLPITIKVVIRRVTMHSQDVDVVEKSSFIVINYSKPLANIIGENFIQVIYQGMSGNLIIIPVDPFRQNNC